MVGSHSNIFIHVSERNVVDGGPYPSVTVTFDVQPPYLKAEQFMFLLLSKEFSRTVWQTAINLLKVLVPHDVCNTWEQLLASRSNDVEGIRQDTK